MRIAEHVHKDCRNRGYCQGLFIEAHPRRREADATHRNTTTPAARNRTSAHLIGRSGSCMLNHSSPAVQDQPTHTIHPHTQPSTSPTGGGDGRTNRPRRNRALDVDIQRCWALGASQSADSTVRAADCPKTSNRHVKSKRAREAESTPLPSSIQSRGWPGFLHGLWRSFWLLHGSSLCHWRVQTGQGKLPSM